jgi:phage tail sheath protein FI
MEGFKLIALTPGLPAPVSPNAARVQTVEFDLVVTRNNIEVERFESLSMQNTLDYYVAAIINDPERGSAYITVADQNSASGVGLDAPPERRDATGRLIFTPLTQGSDGVSPADIDYIGNPAQRTGLYAFDSVQIQLLACPETTSAGVATAALGYCERRGDAMFIGTAPRGLDLEGVKVYASALRGRKVYGALYYPWIQIVNPNDTTGNNPRLWVPPVGHVLGMYARIADTRGVWKAPAGDEALLQNALGVDLDMTDVDHTDLVKNGSVNGIRSIPGAGIIVDSSRTLSTDTRWLFVNVRRLFNFVKVSLRDGLRFVAQEPHSEELRRMVKFSVVSPFLLGLWRQGAFGSDPADQVFTVICGPENNPPAEVNLGNFKIEVYFYPVKPAETIIIVVGQQESGASAAER